MNTITCFDLHGDIGYDVYTHVQKGEKDIFKKRHLKKFQTGGIQVMCMASFFHGYETWEDMQEMILSLKNDLSNCKEVKLVTTLPEKFDLDTVYAILSVEGMCGITSDVETKIKWLYEQGVRLASLTWNDENALATGVKGNPDRGLTDLGRKALSTMEELGMILDISHLNEKSFWDVVRCARKAFIASHSNVYELCCHKRNLNDDQLKAIAKAGGLIGMNTAHDFIDQDRRNQDCKHLVNHMKYISELIGIKHLALGLDCMDYFDDYLMPLDFSSCEDLPNLLKEMKQVFKDDEIKLITMDNAKQFFNKKIRVDSR